MITNQKSDEENGHKHHKCKEEDVGHGSIDQVGVGIIENTLEVQYSSTLDHCIDEGATRSGESFKNSFLLFHKKKQY